MTVREESEPPGPQHTAVDGLRVHGTLASWPDTPGSGNGMHADSTEGRNSTSGRESVSSLWSVGGVLGLEVRNVLNIKALSALLRRLPPPCGARGGKRVTVLCSRKVARVIVRVKVPRL